MVYKYPPRFAASGSSATKGPGAHADTSHVAAEAALKFSDRADVFVPPPIAESPLLSPNHSPRMAAEAGADTLARSSEIAWYEDLRFGGVMLVLLLLLNLALVYAIPLVTPLQTTENAAPSAIHPTENDIPTANPPAPVTMYAPPDTAPAASTAPAAEQSTPALVGNESLSAFPPPKAIPLDHSKSIEENMNYGNDDHRDNQ